MLNVGLLDLIEERFNVSSIGFRFYEHVFQEIVELRGVGVLNDIEELVECVGSDSVGLLIVAEIARIVESRSLEDSHADGVDLRFVLIEVGVVGVFEVAETVELLGGDVVFIDLLVEELRETGDRLVVLEDFAEFYYTFFS